MERAIYGKCQFYDLVSINPHSIYPFHWLGSHYQTAIKLALPSWHHCNLFFQFLFASFPSISTKLMDFGSSSRCHNLNICGSSYVIKVVIDCSSSRQEHSFSFPAPSRCACRHCLSHACLASFLFIVFVQK